MSVLLGDLCFLRNERGTEASLVVLDDGLVVVTGLATANAGVAFGLIGGLLGAGSAKRRQSRRRNTVEENLTGGPAAIAATLKRGEAFLYADLVGVQLTGKGKSARILTITSRDGRTCRLTYSDRNGRRRPEVTQMLSGAPGFVDHIG